MKYLIEEKRSKKSETSRDILAKDRDKPGNHGGSPHKGQHGQEEQHGGRHGEQLGRRGQGGLRIV